MEHSGERDFLFCEMCGLLLSLRSVTFAKCALCGFKRSMKDICGRAISYTVVAEDIRKELGITIAEEQKVQLSKADKKCEKCGHNEAAYYTRQMRSADEGQTTFYTCTHCGHQFQEN